MTTTTTLVWQERFSVGVKGIDRQHRELLARANALFAAIASEVSDDELESLVAFLKGYVHTHFACEERLMRRHGYPGYARHLAEHQRFIDELAWIDDLYDHTGSTDARIGPTTRFLSTWLADHFQRDDRELADFLRAGGAHLHPSAVDQSALRSRTRDWPGPS
jgi:hemerythrin